MTNTSFLDKLVTCILDTYPEQLSDIVIVLPNKRARIFLLEKLKNAIETPFFAPSIISIEEFIQDLAGIRTIDNIELLFEFYEVYRKTTTETPQDFEQFSNWAKIAIQDFNEIDRYLLDADYVFSYLKEIKVLERWDLSIDKKTTLIEKQLEFWKQLPLYYSNFYQHLLLKKIGYQGLLYKEAVQNLEYFSANTTTKQYIFAGFNALNQAEERILQHLIAIDKAQILWDIDTVFLKDTQHDVGLFVRRFQTQWPYYKSNPLEWIVDEFSASKNIQIIGTSKSLGQAKIAGSIIEKIASITNAKLDNVALVLGEEKLLIPVLHALPNSVSSLNITMGYSSKNNPVQLLVAKLFKMHTSALQRDPKNYVFYYKEVLEILTNPIIESYCNVSDLIYKIKSNNYTFITQAKLLALHAQENLLFDLLFQKWEEPPLVILERINSVLLILKENINSNSQEDSIQKTFLYSIYKVINKLQIYCSSNTAITTIEMVYSIYKQIIDLAEVSFEGEPLTGLQIMGVLESRVLDFDTVIITSLNEGKFPAGKSNNSFIPYDIKKEIGLPTYKEKDAIYSYHFYHLLLRAKNIYLLYNTEEDGLDGGEKSRFITQLEVEKQPNHHLQHKIIQPSIPNIAYEMISIPKSEMVAQRLQEIASGKGFSPSALTTYIRNPIQFYLQRVLSIRESEEVEENIALNTLGTIIHKTLEALYTPFLQVYLTEAHIQSMMDKLEDEVLKQFKEVYKEGEIKKGKNLLAFEVAKRNLLNFLKEEKALIAYGDAVKVLQLEVTLEEWITADKLPYPIKISGNVDRIELRNNCIRILDYKTGKVQASDLKISDWKALTSELKNEKIIQLLCYALLYQKELKDYPMEAGIISFKNRKAGFMPFTFFQDKKATTQISSEILENFKEELIGLLLEIVDTTIPFVEKEH